MLLASQSNQNTRVYNGRENVLMAVWLGRSDENTLLLSFEPEWGESGYVIFSTTEAAHLSHALATFFEEGKFIYAKAAVNPRLLPQVYIATTNWGEPYEQGLTVTLCDNFKSAMAQRLSFSLVERDAKDLNNWLQSQLQQRRG